jgi:uncharacterized DUF497 family protein
MKRTGSTSRSTAASRSKRPPLFSTILLHFSENRIVEGEQRWHAIGSAVGAVLLVVHLYRLEDTHDEEENIRIISAREANKRERRIYLQQASE